MGKLEKIANTVGGGILSLSGFAFAGFSACLVYQYGLHSSEGSLGLAAGLPLGVTCGAIGAWMCGSDILDMAHGDYDDYSGWSGEI